MCHSTTEAIEVDDYILNEIEDKQEAASYEAGTARYIRPGTESLYLLVLMEPEQRLYHRTIGG